MKTGDKIPLDFQLFDGATNKFVRAFLFNSLGVQYDTADLSSAGQGLYKNISKIFNDPLCVFVTYVTYTDAGYTTEDTTYTRGNDRFTLDSGVPSGVQVMGKVKAPNISGKVSNPAVIGKVVAD